MYSCGINTDSNIVCWGDNEYGQLNVPAGLGKVVALSVGSNHACAIDSNSRLWCWGLNKSKECDVPAEFNFDIVSVGSGM